MTTTHFYKQNFETFTTFICKYLPITFSFILVVILSHQPSVGQTPEWLWAKNAGGIYNEARGNDVALDPSGNVIVAGAYSCPSLTWNNITITNNGTDDLFVVKFDALGNALWAQGVGGNYAEECYRVFADATGNIYLTGKFWSDSITFGNITLHNSGSSDVFLVKYDAAGNSVWAKSAIGAKEDLGQGVGADADGNVYVSGNFLSDSIEFGTVTLHNTHVNSEDAFLVKYSPGGIPLWGHTGKGNGKDFANDLAVDPSGNIYVTGSFTSLTLKFQTDTLYNSGGNDVFIAKSDSNGETLWARSCSGTGNDFGRLLTTDDAGNVYITGDFSSSPLSFGNNTLNSVGSSDVFVVKYDNSGNPLWAKSAGGNSGDFGHGISVDGAGNAFTTGSFHSDVMSFGNNTLSNTTSSADDFFITKYDAAGNEVWITNGEGADVVHGNSCATDADGNLFVTGTFGNDTLRLGDITMIAYTDSTTDMFVAKYDLEVGTAVSVMNPDKNFLSLSPNPANAFFNIELKLNDAAAQTSLLRIVNSMGQKVYEQTLELTQGKLQAAITLGNEIPNGIYLVRVTADNEEYSTRLVIQK